MAETKATTTANGSNEGASSPLSELFHLDTEPVQPQITFIQLNNEHDTSLIDGVSQYQRLGFYCALSTSPHDALISERQRFIKHSEFKIKQLETQFKEDIDRFDNKLKELNIELGDEKKSLRNLEKDLDALAKERTEIQEKLDKLRIELKKTLHDLGEKKATLIQERLRELENEFKIINDQLEAVIEQRQAINEATFEKNKPSLKEKIELWKRLSDEYEKLHKNTLEKYEKLNKEGISSTVSNFLIYAGYSCSIVAGWFFSIFVLKNNLNSDNTPFSAVQALFSFGEEFLTISNNRFVSVLVFLIAILMLLAVQGVIAWICQRIIDKKIKKAKDVFDFSINYQSENGFAVSTNVKAENAFIFWLKYIPWLFIGSVIFIVLSFGGLSAKLPGLDLSLTGLFVGGSIALLSSGIVFIYLTKIIEPRFESTPDKAPLRRFRANIELAFVILFFIVSILFILFGLEWPLNNSLAANATGIISLLEFLVAVLLTAFTLGYGLRYKGLENTVLDLEFKLKQLQDAIKENSRPPQLNLTATENKDFNEKFLQSRRQIFDMIQAKNDLAKSTLGIKTPEQEADKHESLRELSAKIAQILKNPYIAPLRFLLVLKPLLLRLYREIHKLLISPKAATALREEDEEYFPQFKPLVADLRVRIHEIEAKLEEIEEKMTGIKERSYLFYRQLVSGIQKLEQQIQDYRREKSRYRKGHDQKVNLEIARRTFLILKLDEGFELGIWHVEQTKNNPKIPFAKT